MEALFAMAGTLRNIAGMLLCFSFDLFEGLRLMGFVAAEFNWATASEVQDRERECDPMVQDQVRQGQSGVMTPASSSADVEVVEALDHGSRQSAGINDLVEGVEKYNI
jgi:hypothetical protein